MSVFQNVIAQQTQVVSIAARIARLRDKLIGETGVPAATAASSASFGGSLGQLEDVTLNAAGSLADATVALDELEAAFLNG